MKEKLLWAALAALALLSAGQAYYIFTRHPGAQAAAPEKREVKGAGAYEDPWRELEEWRRSVEQRLRRGDPLAAGDFDGFFDDGFFGRQFSAFEQLERIHRQMLGSFAEPQRGAFGESWDKWFSERMGMGDFRTSVSAGKNEVVLSVDVPGLDRKNADISVNRDRVRLAFSAKESSEEKAGSGVRRSESSRSYVKILPVPPEADGDTAKVSVEADRVRIVFARKKQ